MIEGHDRRIEDVARRFPLSAEKTARVASFMDHGLSKTICLAFAVYLAMGLAALGHPAQPFRYDFAPESFPASKGGNRNDFILTIYPVIGNAPDGSIASLADHATSQQIDAQLGIYAVPSVIGLGYDVDHPLSQLSFQQISGPAVPEPSTILGVIAAAGLMLAFLVARRVQRGSS